MRINKPLPGPDFLRECFEYVADGGLIWLPRPQHHFASLRLAAAWNGQWPGLRAGSPTANGYRSIIIDQVRYLEHRLIYHMMVAPVRVDQEVDHRSTDRSNNRQENLRASTHKQNAVNQPGRRDGALPKHVYWSKRESKYKVQLRAGGKVHFIGTYAHLGEATAAADAARDRLHGEFANKARSR